MNLNKVNYNLILFWLMVIHTSVFSSVYTCDKSKNIENFVIEHCPLIESKDKIESIGIEYKNSTIIYRIIWEDEFYPNQLIDNIYRVYRKVKYGSAKDIEYFAIRLKEKQYYDIFFETYKILFFNIYKHRKIHKVINGNSCKKIKIKVDTWNHLFNKNIECLSENVQYKNIIKVPVFNIGEDFKKRYKLKNRSNPF